MKIWFEQECLLRELADEAYACARREVYDGDSDPHVGLSPKQLQVLSRLEAAESDLRAHRAAS